MQRARKLTAALLAVLLGVTVAACGGNDSVKPEPSTTSSKPVEKSTASVSIDGEGMATDVTITVIDPDTGLKPSDGATGTDADNATPQASESTEVGDSKARTSTLQNVPLPYKDDLTVDKGQQVTVSVQNGTGDGDLTVKVTLDGKTTIKSATGANAAVDVTAEGADK